MPNYSPDRPLICRIAYKCINSDEKTKREGLVFKMMLLGLNFDLTAQFHHPVGRDFIKITHWTGIAL